MKATPILFIDWLDDSEEHDASSLTDELLKDTVEVLDASPDDAGKTKILDTLKVWATNNEDAQLVILSSHGNCHEMGPAKAESTLTYRDIFDMMSNAKARCGRSLELLLMGCMTASAKQTFESSDHPGLQPVIRGFVGFESKPKAAEVRELLKALGSNLAQLNIDYIGKALRKIEGGNPTAFVCNARKGKIVFDQVNLG